MQPSVCDPEKKTKTEDGFSDDKFEHNQTDGWGHSYEKRMTYG